MLTGTEEIINKKIQFLCSEFLLSTIILAPIESLQLTRTLTDITKVAIKLLHQINQEYWRLIKRTSASLLEDDIVASKLFFYSVRGNKQFIFKLCLLLFINFISYAFETFDNTFLDVNLHYVVLVAKFIS